MKHDSGKVNKKSSQKNLAFDDAIINIRVYVP